MATGLSGPLDEILPGFPARIAGLHQDFSNVTWDALPNGSIGGKADVLGKRVLGGETGVWSVFRIKIYSGRF